MAIYFSKIIIGILDYLQKYYKITWLRRKMFCQLIFLYTSFNTYFMVKFILIIVAF